MKPQRVVDEALTWRRVPFHHQGRVRSGVDCLGLVIAVAGGLGILPAGADRTDYGHNPDGAELVGALERYCTPLAAPQPGCVAVIRWRREARHVAIVGGSPAALTLIHSHRSFGGVVEHSLTRAWRSRCLAFFGLPGVDYER